MTNLTWISIRSKGAVILIITLFTALLWRMERFSSFSFSSLESFSQRKSL